MKLDNTDIEQLKSVLWCCRVLDIPAVVFLEGMARGARQSLDAAIISKTSLTIPEDVTIGVGRIAELEKRIGIFGDQLTAELTISNTNDVKVIEFKSGKSKMQFRCTSAALIKYPKRNNDPDFATVTFSKTEATNIVKALKTMGAEDVQFQITRDGNVKLHCVDSSNDKFEIELSEQVKYHDEESSAVYKYDASRFAVLVDTISRDNEIVELIVGERIGSLTGTMKGNTVVIFPMTNDEEGDE